MKPFGKMEVRQYKWKLKSARDNALRVLDKLTSEMQIFDVDSPQDTADQCTRNLAKEYLFRQTSQRRNLVRMIEAALRRTNDGSYGTCVTCGDDISRKRLEALPWTDCCLRCQEAVERERGGACNLYDALFSESSFE